jgi:hypothetical protein
MPFNKIYSLLGNLSLVILVAVGAATSAQNAEIRDLFISTDQSQTFIGAQIARAQCLKEDLPDDVDTFGFLPSLPMRMEDPKITNSIIRLRGGNYRSLYLTQYALAPEVISFYDSDPWIIANYPDYATGLEEISKTELTIVKDCENGVFLLKK